MGSLSTIEPMHAVSGPFILRGFGRKIRVPKSKSRGKIVLLNSISRKWLNYTILRSMHFLRNAVIEMIFLRASRALFLFLHTIYWITDGYLTWAKQEIIAS